MSLIHHTILFFIPLSQNSYKFACSLLAHSVEAVCAKVCSSDIRRAAERRMAEFFHSHFQYLQVLSCSETVSVLALTQTNRHMAEVLLIGHSAHSTHTHCTHN